MVVRTPADLGDAALLAVADGAGVELAPGLRTALAGSRAATLEALASAGPVYGVSTGMGGLAGVAVGATDQPAYQGDLMLARAVGTAPWLGRREVRAATAARLRTLLEPEVGASPQLVDALAALLRTDLHPAVPATGNGAAGEIIPLAHLGGFLSGRGEGLDRDGSVVPADVLLQAAGLAPYVFGPKEGVAFLQGVPVAAAQAVLLAADARLLLDQQVVVAAAEVARVRAPRAPYDEALGRADPELGAVLERLRALAGDEPQPRLLQAPVSFRVVGPALAHLARALRHLEQAVERALAGVSTSPALLGGRFAGTAGFDGFDLSAGADAVRVALLHAAEVGTARLHRLLDPRVSGLPAQLSSDPGRQTGLVALHKRAVGVVHAAVRASAPASLGAVETSLGQEDVQGFGLEATAAARDAAQVLRDVTACELVALHQAAMLDAGSPARGSAGLDLVLRKAFAVLPETTLDRPPGREVEAVLGVLRLGWAHDTDVADPDVPSHPPARHPLNPY